MGKESIARKFLKDFRSLVELAEAVEQLGKIETAASEAEKSKLAAEKDRDGALAEMAEAQDAARRAMEQAKAAEKKHEQILPEAKARAEEIRREGERRAQALINDAWAEVERAKAAAEQEKEAHECWKQKAEVERSALQDRIDALDKQIARIREKVS